MKKNLRFLLIIFLGVFVTSYVQAATRTWTGGTTGFGTVSNWDTEVPLARDDIVFSTGTTVTVTGTTGGVTFLSLTLEGSEAISLDLDMTVASTAAQPVQINTGSILAERRFTASTSSNTNSHGVIGISNSNAVISNGFYKIDSGTRDFGTDGLNENSIEVTSTVTITDAGNDCNIDINGANTGMAAQYDWKGVSALTTPQNGTDGSLDITGAGFAAAGINTITITDANCLLTNQDYSALFTMQVTSICAASLPVELTKFTGIQRKEVNFLEWEIVTKNNEGFDVQKEDGTIGVQQFLKVEK